MKPVEFLQLVHFAEKLKDTTRHCTTSKGRAESVAEHSWRISLMALFLRSEFPELDIDKVIAMCLIHDLGEAFTGDIPSFNKTSSDEKIEDSLFRKWIESLPQELSSVMMKLYDEMMALESKEAKLYKALDKIEAVIQHNESPIESWSENEYQLNKTYGMNEVKFSEWMLKLREEVLNETLRKIDESENSIRRCV
ncbi:putative hydrolases of HD superfamily [Succinivibrio dextrinosolvens]|uniref:HD domain-containing protein n=1 Tax=Succinivibrio dextrinosolvens TaxID=83771 RepID=UPI0008EDFD10|nr:HD domain-containing protein [Succinivibrio dextrinosolvens]SFS36495.1 putative hydrolases of HD superfamily [Succinivibrio dextrinosolvens]